MNGKQLLVKNHVGHSMNKASYPLQLPNKYSVGGMNNNALKWQLSFKIIIEFS